MVDIRVDHDLVRAMTCCTYSAADAVTKGGYAGDWVFVAFAAVFALVVRSRALSVAAFLAPVFDTVREVADCVVKVVRPVSSLYGRHGAQLLSDIGRDDRMINTSLKLGFWHFVAQAVVLLAAAFIRSRTRPTVSPESV